MLLQACAVRARPVHRRSCSPLGPGLGRLPAQAASSSWAALSETAMALQAVGTPQNVIRR